MTWNESILNHIALLTDRDKISKHLCKLNVLGVKINCVVHQIMNPTMMKKAFLNRWRHVCPVGLTDVITATHAQ